jgi:N-formylglutamate deformylase
MFLAENQTMQLITFHEGNTPLVLDSPHSGTHYPQDFGYVCELAMLRKAEDTHVEKLYNFASELGCAWVEAHFPRSYLDTNRNTTEVDFNMLADAWPHPVESRDPAVLSKLKLGKGLIWRLTDDGRPLYGRRLSSHEVELRIASCWQPYHLAVKTAIDAAHARHGYSIHINCHSMPAIASSHATEFPGLAHADFVLGNRDNTTASAALLQAIQEFLEHYGYEVAVNHPYKGVELVRRYGQPAQHRHSVQIEINRKLYMHEDTLQLHAGFGSLQAHLKALVQQLLVTDPRTL